MNSVFVWARDGLLRGLHVPHDPEPPAGAPGSLRIFRAGRNYYRLKFWLWAVKHAVALIVFLFMLWLFHHAIQMELARWQEKAEVRGKADQVRVFKTMNQYAWWLPVFECFSFGLALLQLPFSYALMRLDYEQRWYLVTDRSLRIRAGIWNVREMTLSFANIQQTTLQQGPLQRLLGLADLVVTTAGGGDSPGASQTGSKQTSWHTGILQAVDNASEIRDLIQDRIRRLKSSGTSDSDDRDPETAGAATVVVVPPTPKSPAPLGALTAAKELLAEVRALRNSW